MSMLFYDLWRNSRYKFYFRFVFVFIDVVLGNQPVDGTMNIDTFKHRLPGFEHDSRLTIKITYHFPNGIQDVSYE